MGELLTEFLFIVSMEKKKSVRKSICHPFRFPILPLSSRKAVKTSTIQFPPKKNKGFINYVFCRNWTVRNPAGTRLNSSGKITVTFEPLMAVKFFWEFRISKPVQFSLFHNWLHIISPLGLDGAVKTAEEMC